MVRFVCLICVLFAGVLAYAQSLAETSLAAATGSVAGVAAKPINDGLTKIFGQISAQAKTAATGEQLKTKAGPTAAPSLAEGPAATGPAPARVQNRANRKRPRMHYAALPPELEPKPVPAVAVPPPPPPRPTLQQIAMVTAGTERPDVIAKLGTPASRLLIPEGGQMLEIYQYLDRQGNVGSVRLRDGRVSEVRVDAP